MAKVKENKEEILEVTEEEFNDVFTDEDDVVEGLQAESNPSIPVNDPLSKFKGDAVDVVSMNMTSIVAALGKETAEALDKMEKYKIIVPMDPLNVNVKEDTYVVVSINSRVFQIQRDIPVLIPKPLLILLSQGGYNPTIAM